MEHLSGGRLFDEDEEYGHDQAEESGYMIPLDRLSLEQYGNYDGKYSK